MGFTEDDDPIHLENPLNKEEVAHVLDQSAKILTFFDAPGHIEYSKTMIRSILGGDAQYGMILVPAPEGANLIKAEEERSGARRLDDISREHLILMSGQDIPFIVGVSKVDKASPEEIEFVYKVVRRTLKEIGKIPVNIKSQEDILPVIREIGNGVVVPIIQIAATEEKSLHLLTHLLKQLPLNSNSQDLGKPARAYVDKVYRGIRGTNVVVTGTVKNGVFKTGQMLMIGPDENGKMMEGRLFSVEMFKKRVNTVKSGDLFGFDIKDVDKHKVKRGQVVSDNDDTIKSSKTFEADIVVTRHPTRISIGYTPVFQSNTIQHTVIFKKIYDHEYLSVGDFARVQLEFMRHPEAVEVGDKIVLREANTRAIGTIVEIVK
jgi:GTPase